MRYSQQLNKNFRGINRTLELPAFDLTLDSLKGMQGEELDNTKLSPSKASPCNSPDTTTLYSGGNGRHGNEKSILPVM
jgi:hypothetical protein